MGYVPPSNHGAGGGNSSIMVGMVVCLCLASQNPFEWEFFVPARTDLGVKLLMPFWLSLPTVGERLLYFTQRERK